MDPLLGARIEMLESCCDAVQCSMPYIMDRVTMAGIPVFSKANWSSFRVRWRWSRALGDMHEKT